MIFGLATAAPIGIVALAVLFGAHSGAKIVGGVERWQMRLQTINGSLIVAVSAYLTISAALRTYE